MERLKCTVLCLVLVFCLANPIIARKSYSSRGSHSYPKSHSGLSGSGSHNSHQYPKSPGLSGNSHGYPGSGGSHGYPSSGGSHGYPSSGGQSSGGSYPASGGLSGNNKNHGTNGHGYPPNAGLSGNSPPKTTHHTTNNIHNHYNYAPPQQISYAPSHGAPAISYPVYHGTPPNYVYQYKDSGSKYGTLLAGLALFNLGALGGVAAAKLSGGSHSSQQGSYNHIPGEVCKFAVKKDNGDYEETKIDCRLISSFIIEEEAKQNKTANNTVTTITTTTKNVTTINGSSDVPNNNETAITTTEAPYNPNIRYIMLPNGTFVVDSNSTAENDTVTESSSTPASNDSSAHGSTSSVVTTTVTNTTVVNAVDVKGPPVDVTPGMKCYVIRSAPTSSMRKTIPCGLLQTYAEKSLKKNAADRLSLSIYSLIALVSIIRFV